MARGGRRTIARALWLGAALCLALFAARSHSVSARSAGPWQWEPYNQGLPTYALTVTVAVQPDNPSLLYAGTYEPPGLWRSDDGGRSWAADDEGLDGGPVMALYRDVARARWLAGGRDGLYARPSGAQIAGAYPGWGAAGLQGHIVHAVAGDAAGTLYAAAGDGLYRSRDGATWETLPAGGGLIGPAVLDLAVSPDGRTLLVGTAGQGLWVSRDGGTTWSQASTDAGPLQGYVTALLLAPTPHGAAYASTSERAYRSADGGTTWEAMTTLEGRVHAFAAAPDGAVYAALTGRVARSSDGGRTWEVHTAGLRPGDKVLGLAHAGAARLYAAAWDGVYASQDGAQTWVRLSDGLGYSDVNTLAWDGDGNLLAGTRSGLYRRQPGGPGWESVPCSAGRGVMTLADAGNGRDFYAGLSGGLARSRDGGRTWSEVTSELTPHGIAGVVIDPLDPDHLYAWVAFSRAYESHDGGANWIARWEGLGTVLPVTAIHRAGAGQVYAGTEEGVYRYDAGCQAWSPLPLPLVAPTVFVVRSDARDPGSVYVGATDGLWRSRDAGAHWSRWGTGLEGVTVTALAISPASQTIALAGTRHAGLYVTTDRGAHWSPAWDGRLASASGRDIVFSRDGSTVYVASNQGIWRGARGGLDD